MKITMGHSLAVIFATTSLAFAGGDGDDDKKKGARTLERLSTSTAPADAKVTAAPGKGFTVDIGDEFSVNLSNRVQILWQFAANDPGQDTNNFSVRRARTKLKGHVWNKDMTYQLQLEWANSTTSNIKDAWFNWAFWHGESGTDHLGVRLGAQKPHFGREFTGTSAGLEHTFRSLASRTFTGNRVLGAMLHGSHLEGGKLHWSAMVGNADAAAGSSAADGGGDNASNVDNEVDFYFDIRVDPWGDMGSEGYKQGDLAGAEEVMGQIGAALQVGNHRNAANTQDVDTTTINVYTAWKYKGFHALGEVFLRSDDPDVAGGQEADSDGYAVGGSYTLAPAEEGAMQWSFGARYSLVGIDDAPVLVAPLGAATTGDISAIEGTVTAYYHGHALKTHVNFRHTTIEPDGAADIDIDTIEILFQWQF